MGDDVELLEDFGQYCVESKKSNVYYNHELTSDTFKNPEVYKHLKEALFDCITHHQVIMNLMNIFECQMNFFVLLKVGDINLLLTIILFAVVSFLPSLYLPYLLGKTSPFFRQLRKISQLD